MKRQRRIIHAVMSVVLVGCGTVFAADRSVQQYHTFARVGALALGGVSAAGLFYNAGQRSGVDLASQPDNVKAVLQQYAQNYYGNEELAKDIVKVATRLTALDTDIHNVGQGVHTEKKTAKKPTLRRSPSFDKAFTRVLPLLAGNLQVQDYLVGSTLLDKVFVSLQSHTVELKKVRDENACLKKQLALLQQRITKSRVDTSLGHSDARPSGGVGGLTQRVRPFPIDTSSMQSGQKLPTQE